MTLGDSIIINNFEAGLFSGPHRRYVILTHVSVDDVMATLLACQPIGNPPDPFTTLALVQVNLYGGVFTEEFVLYDIDKYVPGTLIADMDVPVVSAGAAAAFGAAFPLN
jgi:hypothetical protein